MKRKRKARKRKVWVNIDPTGKEMALIAMKEWAAGKCGRQAVKAADSVGHYWEFSDGTIIRPAEWFSAPEAWIHMGVLIEAMRRTGMKFWCGDNLGYLPGLWRAEFKDPENIKTLGEAKGDNLPLAVLEAAYKSGHSGAVD